jgi:GNAT superfamily N-acetyltransferase
MADPQVRAQRVEIASDCEFGPDVVIEAVVEDEETKVRLYRELETLFRSYLSPDVAAALLADAEARIAASGNGKAWLACAIGNARAARFYEKCGWHHAGNMINYAETSDGPFPLEVWRYEKALSRPA